MRGNFTDLGHLSKIGKILQPPCNGLLRNTQAVSYRLLDVAGQPQAERLTLLRILGVLVDPSTPPAYRPGRHTQDGREPCFERIVHEKAPSLASWGAARMGFRGQGRGHPIELT